MAELINLRAARKELLATFSTELAKQAQANGGGDGSDRSDAGDPWAMASVAVTMLVNVAIQREVFAAADISDAALLDSVARLLLAAVTGSTDA